MTAISVYMITFNNERTVEKALKSLSWADEIVVVDSFSTDRTVEIVKKYATKFSQQKFLGHQKQYQLAASMCANDWRFFLDADEVVPPEMVESMKKKMAVHESVPLEERIFGFYGNRLTFYLGKWITHGGWLPDNELRLYHKGHGDWTPGLHSCLAVKGKTAFLEGAIAHYSYADISDQLKTIDKYSTIAADDMLKAGKRVSLMKMILNPPWRFFRDFVLKCGFLDGVAGFIIAINTMFYVFVKHAKLYELQRVKKSEADRNN